MNMTETTDCFGYSYESIEEMCMAYNIKPATYRHRIANGWDKDEALIIPVDADMKYNQHSSKKIDACIKNLPNKPVYDHLGNRFKSVSDKCKFYGISKSAYKSRKRKMSEKDALTLPYKCHLSIKDHMGNEYSTKNEMCGYYNIDPHLYNHRIKSGWPKKEALTLPKQCGKRSVYDHLGNPFESQNSMLRYYGISKSQFESRIRNGHSLEKALTSKVRKIATKAYDHLGNEYTNNKEMCAAYGISIKLYEKRFYERKWTVEEALTIPRNMYIGEYRVAECLKRLNVKFYHDCSIKTIFADLGLSIDWNEFLTELQSRLGSAGYNWSKQKIQRLRPDFVLYTDENNKIRGVIEFDGEQHQNFVEFFFKTIEEFYRRSDADFAKQNFWEYLNIPMLRIRHDQIDMIDDMVQDFIDNPQNYIHNHNTYLSENEYWSILTEQKSQIEMAFAV